jgi:hypothetical protein
MPPSGVIDSIASKISSKGWNEDLYELKRAIADTA